MNNMAPFFVDKMRCNIQKSTTQIRTVYMKYTYMRCDDTFNVCSTWQPEWSVEPWSLIADCSNCFTLSYIGWTLLNVSSINSESQFTGVCRTRLLGTWWTCTSYVSSGQSLRLANRRSTFGRRAFSVAGQMEWNSLPHSLRDPARSTDSFRSALKTHLFAAQKTSSALEALCAAL